MTDPLVSACICVYNREQYIRPCIDSVLAQSYPRIEIVVVDDGSTDATPDILREFGEQITFIERPSNSGIPAVARNQAMDEARGELIAFLDSDDIWFSEKIRKQVHYMGAHPTVGLVHCYCESIDEKGDRLGTRHEGAIPEETKVFGSLLKHSFIVTSTVMLKREVCANGLRFNENPAFVIGEDYEFFLRVARDYEVGFIPDVLAQYRKSDGGISQTDSAWRNGPLDIVAMREVYRQPDIWTGAISRATFKRLLARSASENAMYWRGQGRPGRALWAVAQALRAQPMNTRCWAEGVRTIGRLVLRGRK